MHTFETLMLRLTTNVTRSPFSSARSSSAAWRMSSIASGPASAKGAVASPSGAAAPRPRGHRGRLALGQPDSAASLGDPARPELALDRPVLAAARAAAGYEAPV